MADNQETYTVKVSASILEVSPETLRRYTGFYAEWLSDYATPGEGLERKFTQEDIRTLSWCWSQTREGQTREEIAQALPFVDDTVLPSWASLTGLGAEREANAVNQTGSTAIDIPGRMVKLLEQITDQSQDRQRQDAELAELRSQIDTLTKRVEALQQQETQPGVLERIFGRKPQG